MSGRCFDSVWKVFQVMWKVSEKCLEGILKGSGSDLKSIWKVSEYCPECVWKVSKKCFESVLKASESYQVGTGQFATRQVKNR